MPEENQTVATEQAGSTAPTEESSELSQDSSFQDVVAEELLSPADKPKVEAEQAEVAAQDTKGTEATEAESQATAEPAETESQEPESKAEVSTADKPRTARRIETLVTKLKDKDREIVELKNIANARVQSFQPDEPIRPPEQTPEYWQQQYARLKQEGLEENDIRVQHVLANYQRFDRESFAERVLSAQKKQESVKQEWQQYNNAMFEVHESTAFLVPSDKTAFGYDLDPNSEVTKTMLALAARDGKSIAGNPALVLDYARRAETVLLRQRLNGEHATADELKRKQAESIAKGTMSAGNRRPPPAAKPATKKLDDLQQRAMRGDYKARRELGLAALQADLG